MADGARAVRLAAGRAATIVVACGALVPAGVRAQALDGLGRHGLVIEGGRLWQGVEDALASTTQYAGDAGVAAVGYRFWGAAWRIGFGMATAGPRLTPRASPYRTTHEDARLWTGDVWALRRVWRSEDGRWAAFAGPALAMDVGLRRHFYRLDRTNTFDNGFLGLEATGQVELDLGTSGRLTEQVMVPVLGVAVRTPYNTGVGGAAPDVHVGSLPSFLLVRHRLEYRVAVGDRLVTGVSHEGSLVRHGDPLDLAVAWHRLSVGVELVWGRP